ncbi:MAG TPA: glycosyltransferase family 2 protein [Saprospiraceae bacterium]|nr:glycosyltransferase family 2 protein [Saprospiraceae bacterium]
MNGYLENNLPDLVVIVPIFNEEKILHELYERLTKAAKQVSENYRLLFINDGSNDASMEVILTFAANDENVEYIDLSRNFGHQQAVSAGLDAVEGKAVVIIDGDLQDPPELIPEMYIEYKKGYDIVYAQRKRREGESVFKLWTAKLFYRLLRSMTAVSMPVDTGDFRLIDQKVVNCLKQMPEKTKFLRGQIAWLGFRQSAYLYDREKRKAGSSAYTISKMVRLALDGITGFSDKPLQLVSLLGFLFCSISFLVILYALYAHYVLEKTITGWTSLIISSMFIGGVQLLSLGIIGLYISRINTNVLNRPFYIIRESKIRSNNRRS